MHLESFQIGLLKMTNKFYYQVIRSQQLCIIEVALHLLKCLSFFCIEKEPVKSNTNAETSSNLIKENENANFETVSSPPNEDSTILSPRFAKSQI